jgi:hypothetical protein
LLESTRFAEGVGALLNLGRCYEVLGRTASAHRNFVRAEEIAAARGDPRREEARQRARAIESDLSVIVVHVPRSMRSASVEVRIDGELLPVERWETPFPVDPGTRRIELSAPPHPRQSASVVVGEKGARAEWSASVPPPIAASSAKARPSAPMTGPPRPAAGSDASAGTSAARPLGLVTGGAGLAGLALGAVAGVVSISAHSAVVGRCSSYPVCSSADRASLDETNDRARTSGTISTVSFVAGAILLAGGAALFFTASSPQR